MKQFGTFIWNTIYTLVVLAVLALALLFVGTKVSLLGYEVKVVQSGSMEPAILTGSLVVITNAAEYMLGDVVTYGEDSRTNVPVTHRIVEKEGAGARATFITKGDANEEVDPVPVQPRDIIGKVAFTLPYLGYLIEFARTKLGFALLIGIPALFIILDEFANIVWEIRKYRARVRYFKERQARMRAERSSASPNNRNRAI